MEFKSINPYNNEVLAKYNSHSNAETSRIIQNGHLAFTKWRYIPISERSELMKKAANILRSNTENYARLISLEMGKPISESRGEINKCAWVCDYYADHTEDFLKDEIIKTDANKSLVRQEPIGCVLAIMPWNFPFWQVFRFAAPSLMAGNTGILKHAPNVFGCARLIEEIFTKAGFPEYVFQNVIVNQDQVENIIADDRIKAVTLTGSERAGSAVASIAGKYIKKSLLELGGNNAYIVWEDADLDRAVQTAITARMLNCGQSCIAAKRFIIVESVYDQFVTKFIEAVKKLKSGDPMKEETNIGPLARKDLADQLQKQVSHSIDKGAELLIGGKQKDSFHEATVLGNVVPGMPAFDEETFGPLAAMIKAKDPEHAFRLSEMSKYGLGTTVFTNNVQKALEMSHCVSDGAYFINELVKSDPRLPFGGTKNSGYGRELAKDGMMEFVNRKTIYVK